MKRKLAILLVGLMILTFSGCGNKAIPSDTTVAEASSDPESVTESVSEENLSDSSDADSPEDNSSEESSSEAAETIPAYSLKNLYAEHDMKVGTCLTTQMIGNTQMSKLILEQFNSVTMENSMKPDYLFNKEKSIETGNLVVEFNQDMLEMLDWAKENKMAVRGHTLVWHSQTPAWIFHEEFNLRKPLVSREVMLDRLDSYIRQVFENLEAGGYTELFYAYDVVNEAWMDDGTMRLSDWKKTIGDDYLWHAFNIANQYAPDTIDLYYNDYNEQFKEDTLIEFVNTLVDEEGNYLIDGIGLQAHLYTRDDLEEYFEAIDKLAATGLKLELTELDVSLGAYQDTLQATEENLKIQGQFYYNLVNGLFERIDAGSIQMDALTYWGFSDGLSWRKAASPLLYTKSLEPKFSYYGAVQVKEMAGFDE